MSDRLSFDPPRLTRDEATEMCVWHLRMAAAMFQLVPDDGNKALLSEIERQTKDDIDDVDREPAKAWAALMLSGYDSMKDKDDEGEDDDQG